MLKHIFSFACFLAVASSLSCNCYHNNCNGNSPVKCPNATDVCFGVYNSTTIYSVDDNGNPSTNTSIVKISEGCTATPQNYVMGCDAPVMNEEYVDSDNQVIYESVSTVCNYICNYGICNGQQALSVYFSTIANKLVMARENDAKECVAGN